MVKLSPSRQGLVKFLILGTMPVSKDLIVRMVSLAPAHNCEWAMLGFNAVMCVFIDYLLSKSSSVISWGS
jgi:hypothetical protein